MCWSLVACWPTTRATSMKALVGMIALSTRRAPPSRSGFFMPAHPTGARTKTCACPRLRVTLDAATGILLLNLFYLSGKMMMLACRTTTGIAGIHGGCHVPARVSSVGVCRLRCLCFISVYLPSFFTFVTRDEHYHCSSISY